MLKSSKKEEKKNNKEKTGCLWGEKFSIYVFILLYCFYIYTGKEQNTSLVVFYPEGYVQNVKYLIVKPWEGTGVVISKIFRLSGMEAFCLGMDTAGYNWVLSDVSVVQQ